MRITGWTFLALSIATWAFSSFASSERCIETLDDGPLTFGEAFDTYSKGKVPDLEGLRVFSWELKGIFVSPKSSLSWSSQYDPTGLRVEDTVPLIHFMTRDELKNEKSDIRFILSWDKGEYFVVRRSWGVRDTVLPGLSVFEPKGWLKSNELKKNSLTFSIQNQIYKDGGVDLFLRRGQTGTPFKHVQLYCRLVRGMLICMGEEFNVREELFDSSQISFFLIFESKNLSRD